MRSKDESLAEFRRVFKSEQEFLKWLWEREGSTCSCGSNEFVYSENLRSRYCQRKHRISVTAKTIFRNCKTKALLALAMALWLAADGILVSASELSRLNNIEESSAWEILKKVGFLARSLMGSEAQAPSEAFASVIARRSIETPRKQHPRTELLAQPNAPGEISDQQILDAVAMTMKVIDSIHQRISRKYLQLFAATMIFVHEKLDFIDLMMHSIAMGPVTRSDILAYLSPPLIELARAPAFG